MWFGIGAEIVMTEKSGSPCLSLGDERFSPPKRLGCIGTDNYNAAERVQNMFDVLMSSEFISARLLRNFQGNSKLSQGSTTCIFQRAGKRTSHFWTVLSPVKAKRPRIVGCTALFKFNGDGRNSTATATATPPPGRQYL